MQLKGTFRGESNLLCTKKFIRRKKMEVDALLSKLPFLCDC